MILQACPGGAVKGSIFIGEGNKSRVEAHDKGQQRDGNSVIAVSDGKKLATVAYGATLRLEDVPKWQNQAHKVALARMGATPINQVPLADADQDFRADEAFAVSDFKLGKAARIGRQDACLIQYTLVTKGLDVRTTKT